MKSLHASGARTLTISLALALLMAVTASASLNSHDVLLVVNDQSSVSVAIGNYYKVVRGIPEINVCHLTACPTNEWIDVQTWYDQIKTPIWNYLNATSHPWLANQVKVILLTKGVPLGFWTDGDRASSVDMPLCYLGNTCSAGTEPIGGAVGQAGLSFSNRYFTQDQSFESFRGSSANQYTTTFSGPLQEIHRFDSGTTIAAGVNGLDGVMIASTDGVVWSAIDDGKRAFPGTALTSIASVGSTGWATQDNGRIIKSTNSGTSWSCVRSSSAGTVLCSVSFADSNTGWAVGSQSGSALLLGSSGGGSWDWQPVDLSSLSLPSCTLNGVCTAGTDRVIACGTGGVLVKGVRNGGTWSWSKISVPSVSYNSVALRLSGSAYVGWVVGSGGTILKTTDSGSTWQQQTSNTSASLNRVFVLDDSHAWATTGSSTLLRTTDGGTTWQVLSLQPGQNLQAACFANSSSGYAVCGNNIFSTTDGGATWSTVFTGQSTVWHENYLCCRLDGYQLPVDENGLPVDIRRMIDSAANPDSSGCFVLDKGLKSPPYKEGDDWMDAAYSDMVSMGVESAIDSTYTYLTDVHLGSEVGGHTLTSDVMGYCSWGSNDGNNHSNTQWAVTRNTWRKGSMSTTHVSSSGRTFYAPDYSGPTPVYYDSWAPSGTLQFLNCGQGWSATLHNNSTGQNLNATSSNGTISFSISSEVTDGYVRFYFPDGLLIGTATIDAGPATRLAPGMRYSMNSQTALSYSGTTAPAGTLRVTGCWQGWTGILHDNATGEEVAGTPSGSTLSFPVSHDIADGYLQVYYPDGSPVYSGRITASSSTPLGPTRSYSVSYQSLAADSLHEGCSATIGHVTEPLLYACGQPQYLFPRYAEGFSWAECAYMSLQYGAWREVAVGDPLMRAYGTPPTVSLNSPGTDGAVISGTAYTLTAAASSTQGINRVDFWLTNGQGIDALIGTATSSPYSIIFNTTTLPAPYSQSIPDGRYVLEAIAYDQSNVRQVGKASRPVVINNGGSPASVSITNPATDGTTLADVATIGVAASPSGPPSVTSIDVWLHGISRDMLIGTLSAPGNLSFDTTSVPDGDYSLQAVAYSTTGQASASSARQVIVDNSSLIQITNPPTDGQTVAGAFTVSTSCASSVTRVDFWMGQNSSTGTLIASDTSAPFLCSIDSATFANGNYTIRALAYTTGCSQAVNTAVRKIVISNSSLLAFTTPTSDGQTFSGSASIQVTAGTTTPAIDHVDLWPYGNQGYAIRSNDSTSPFNWSLDTTTLANGSYTLRAVAYKVDGGQVADMPTRTIIVNNGNLLSVNAPATDGTTVSGTTTLVIGAQTTTPDIARVDIHFTGKNTSEQVWTITGRPFQYALNTTNYQDGFYTITVYAYKSDGRRVMNSSATRQFTINNNHPVCSVSAARALADSSPCMLEGKIVSVGNSAAQSAMENVIYVEEPDRFAGVRVAWSYSTIPTGKVVTILGTVSNFSRTGERQIVADDIWVGPDATTPIQPLGMIGKSVGGIPPATETHTNGVTGGVGLYNSGLLARVWGRVVYVGSDFIYLDDGSGLLDGNNLQNPYIVPLTGGSLIDPGIEAKGLRVYFGNIAKPGIDDYVAITGISSLETVGSNRVRLIRTRSAGDVTYSDQYTPAHIILGGIAPVGGSTPLDPGTKVRLVDNIVQNIFTWQGSTSIWIREQSGLNVVVAIPTQLQQGQTLPLSIGDTITVTGVIMSERSPQGFWQIDATEGHVYWGGSTYGAMSVGSSSTRTNALSSVTSSPSRDGRLGGGPFKPWPGPTVEEILASESFRLQYGQVGAIGWALSLPDGSVIDLPAEAICGEWYDGRVLGLREWFEPTPNGPRLFLYLDQPIKLETRFRDMATIDIIGGKLVTLSGGIRALVKPEAVYAYTDSTGQWMFPLPWPKFVGRSGIADGSENWPWKTKVAP